MKFFACIVLSAVLAVAASEEFVGSSYGGQSYGHAVHAGPAKSYTYPSPAPHVPCAKNLLFSCAPAVAPVPCSAPSYGYSAPSYGEHSGYVGAAADYQGPNKKPKHSKSDKH